MPTLLTTVVSAHHNIVRGICLLALRVGRKKEMLFVEVGFGNFRDDLVSAEINGRQATGVLRQQYAPDLDFVTDSLEHLTLLRDLIPDEWSRFVIREERDASGKLVDLIMAHYLRLPEQGTIDRVCREPGWSIDRGGIKTWLHKYTKGREAEVIMDAGGKVVRLRVV